MGYKIAEPELVGNAKKYVKDCLDTNWISSRGKYVKKFEDSFAKFCKVKYASATSNGTVSLHLILLALGIRKGDEVIIPNFTYIATANSVKYVGAKPVFVDADPETFNIDVDKIESKINKNTKAIIVVHIYGNPCDMNRIMKIAKKYKLFVIEDAAEAHGATYDKKSIGSFGVANSFSFFGNKTLTCGEGGMITTNSKDIFEKINLLKNQGQKSGERYIHVVLGYNYRLTNIQAAIGFSQVEKVNYLVGKKRKIHRWYSKYLKGLISMNLLSLQKDTKNSKSSYWMNAIILHGVDRRKIENLLTEKNIETRSFFLPMSQIEYLKEKTKKRYVVSEQLYKSGLLLPSSTKLTELDVKYICNTLSEILYKLINNEK